ncbi:MAG: hypothetical protein ABF295_04700 [Flavobacteriaceae bacterium]
MKTIARITTVTALMLATVAGHANGTDFVISGPNSDTELEILESADKGKRIFRQQGDMVYLNMLNLLGEEVKIKVFDSSGRILFTEVIRNDSTIEKAFNFKNAYADSYTVMVKDSEGTYRENILIK